MKNIEYICVDDIIKEEEKGLLEILDKKKVEEFLNENIDKSKHCLELISKLINRVKQIKYKNKKVKKYGKVSRALKKEDIQLIIDTEEKEKFKLCFEIAYKIGLRESEVVAIKLEDIYDNWTIKIKNKKCSREEFLIIPISLRNRLKKYIEERKEMIMKKKGFIFYSENPRQIRNMMKPSSLSKRFRKISLKCGINYCYGMSEEPEFDCRGRKRSPRKLFQFCMHSFRHSFGNEFYKISGNDIVKTCQALRHEDIKTTMGYIFANQGEVFNVMESM